jgi:hypothetical protein
MSQHRINPTTPQPQLGDSDMPEIIALCLLVDCDRPAPYIASRDDTDEPKLYDVDYDAFSDIEDYREQGVKCRLIPILRHTSRPRGAPSWMHGLDFVPGVKNQGV